MSIAMRSTPPMSLYRGRNACGFRVVWGLVWGWGLLSLSFGAGAQITQIDSARLPQVNRSETSLFDDDREIRLKIDDDESIYILQKRNYTKKGRLEASPFFFTALNPRFVRYAGAGLSLSAHIKEGLAIELLTSVFVNPSFSSLVFEITEYTPRNVSLVPDLVDYKRFNYFGAGSLQFSALYGKFRAFGSLIDYDFYVSVGAGIANTLDPCSPNTGGCVEEDTGYGFVDPPDPNDRLQFAGLFGAGFRFFFNEYVGLKAEVRDLVYADRFAGDTVNPMSTDIRNTVMAFVGLSFMTPKVF